MTGQSWQKQVLIRAHGSLADFRPRSSFEFRSTAFAKDAIEGVGIPHTEVDFISVNGSTVDFKMPLRGGDVVEVFPAGFFPHLYSPVRPPALPEFRFVVDENSAKLANALLLLGFDTKYSRENDDPRLAEISDTENRILLTRDIGLLKRARVRYGYWVRRDSPRDQILEVLRKYELWPHRKPLSRCLKCNSPLVSVAPDDARPFVPLGAWERNTEFFRCHGCGSVYWKGSHFLKMQEWLLDLENQLRNDRPDLTSDGTLPEDSTRNTEDDFFR